MKTQIKRIKGKIEGHSLKIGQGYRKGKPKLYVDEYGKGTGNKYGHEYEGW